MTCACDEVPEGREKHAPLVCVEQEGRALAHPACRPALATHCPCPTSPRCPTLPSRLAYASCPLLCVSPPTLPAAEYQGSDKIHKNTSVVVERSILKDHNRAYRDPRCGSGRRACACRLESALFLTDPCLYPTLFLPRLPRTCSPSAATEEVGACFRAETVFSFLSLAHSIVVTF